MELDQGDALIMNEKPSAIAENPSIQLKRRGRKRKSDVVKDTVLEGAALYTETFFQEPENEMSRSGRKRKSVNYFALANPDILDENETKMPKKKYSIMNSLSAEQPKVSKTRDISTIAQPVKDSIPKSERTEEPLETSSCKKSEVEFVDMEKFSETDKDSSNCRPIQINNVKEFKSIKIGKQKLNDKIEEIKTEELGLLGKSTLEIDESILASVGLTKDLKRTPCTSSNVEIIQAPSSQNNGFEAIESSSFETPKNQEEQDDSGVKKNKYRKTGDTVRMISTLFSQFIGIPKAQGLNSAAEVDCKPTVVIPEADAPYTPLRRGRPPGKGKGKATPKNQGEAPADTGTFISDHNTVTCAMCNKEMSKVTWIHHKQRFHNNLSWRVGEPPLDLSNQALVMQILNALYKSKKPLYCDLCDQAKKSVVGFLSHKAVCGKTDAESQDLKVPCKYCNKRVFPASMPSHVKLSHETTPQKEEKKCRKSLNVPNTKTKRQAATKALKVIQYFKAETTLGTNNEFLKYFADLSFISTSVAKTMLQKQIISSRNVQCKYVNCTFETSSLETIQDHLISCRNKPNQGFVCKHCLNVQQTVNDIILHIERTHDVYIQEAISSDSEGELPFKSEKTTARISNNKKKLTDKNTIVKKTPYFLNGIKKLDVTFEKSYSWTINFHHEQYTTRIQDSHFTCTKNNWDLMNVDAIESYLPRMGVSCDVNFSIVQGFQNVIKREHSFKKFELFESLLDDDGNSSIFCGGPVNALAWMPTPFNVHNANQILAVACRKDPDTTYTNDSNYDEDTIIQFWNFGPLRNLQVSTTKPVLALSLTFKHGPVWYLEWCPSGCYDTKVPKPNSDKDRRMGVLAVAGSDSNVYVYSIPFLSLDHRDKFYEAKPVLKLLPMYVQDVLLSKRKFYPTRLSWSKAAGHRYLAAGYTNGMVAMFDLFSSSKLLRKIDEFGLVTLLPYKSFQAHYHYISALVLYHLNEGCRWLLTGSCDKSVSLWDLNDVNSPVTSYKRQIVTDGIWMSNWLCHIISYDEASSSGPVASSLTQVRNYLSDILYMFHSSTTVTGLTGSDWLNGLIQTNAVGEIFATFPKQLLVNLGRKCMKNKKLLLGYTSLIEKGKSKEQRAREYEEKEKALRNELTVKTNIKDEEIPLDREVTHLDYNPHYYKYEPLVYHEIEEKYGLVFCDAKMNSYSDFPATLQQDMHCGSKKFHIAKPNIYPLQAINKVEFNPNRQATTYYVTGYQSGFVRVTCLKFLKTDPQVIADMKDMTDW